MKVWFRSVTIPALCWLACCLLEGCALLNGDRSQGNTQSYATDQEALAPAVPVPSRNDAADVDLTRVVGLGTAHLTAGLRSTNNESNLDIASQPSGRQSSSYLQQVPLAQRSAWTDDRLTWEQARSRLRERGVIWLQLDLRDGVWRLQCSIPDRQNAQKQRFYEAQANDELSAVRAVLTKIDNAASN